MFRNPLIRCFPFTSRHERPARACDWAPRILARHGIVLPPQQPEGYQPRHAAPAVVTPPPRHGRRIVTVPRALILATLPTRHLVPAGGPR